MEAYPHLKLEREQPITEKRPKTFYVAKPPSDLPRHARWIAESLGTAREAVKEDVGGFDERPLFKLRIGTLIPEQIEQGFPGVEVISQEGGEYALVFASPEALSEFEARLTTLAAGGTPKYANILYALQAFERWTPEDRKGWALKHFGLPTNESFVLDVEMWPLSRRDEHNALVESFETWLQQQEAAVLDSINVEGLLVYRLRVNNLTANLILKHRDVRTVDIPPRFGLELAVLSLDIQGLPVIPTPPDNSPVVAVLDSGIAGGHPLIKPALGDAQGFLPPDKKHHDEHGHGTHVAGIAIYGDIEECVQSKSFVPQLRLLSGRVLNDRAETDSRFIENIIEEAVRYFHESYRCRVFNLSYGDLNKPYLGGRVRGLAYTLDRLSRELDVLFIVPTGNVRDIPLGWLKNEYPDYLFKPEFRLLDPAPAINVITVGSLARWDQHVYAQRWPKDPRLKPVALHDQPSPFSRCGASVKDAIKPELVSYGGNLAIHLTSNHISDHGLGELSMSKDFATGQLLSAESGTSFAAPHIAHYAARLLSAVPSASMNLLRALLVANARIPHASIALFNNNEDALAQTVGYGQVDVSGLYRSTEEQVILIAETALLNKHHHFYQVPIPESFYNNGGKKSRRREITVSIAHCPPVRTTRLDYKAARFEFRLVEADTLDEVTTTFNKATSDEEYEKIAELSCSKMCYGTRRRSSGTVQASSWIIKQTRAKKQFVVITRSDPGWGAPYLLEEEPYALVIRLTDRENENARLYTEIQALLQIRERERQRVRL